MPFPQPQSSTPTLLDITDPLPAPPESDPRQGMLPEAAMYVVAPGEYVRIFVEIRAGVHLVYPSGWEEDHDWDSFEERLKKPPFDLVEFRERRELTSRITNFRRTIYWPNERRDRIIMRDPDRPGHYDAERAVVVPPGEIFA